jgi:hypothetical protein
MNLVLEHSRVARMRIGWVHLNTEACTPLACTPFFLTTSGFPLHSLLRFGCAALLVTGIVSSWWASTRQGGDFNYPHKLSHSVLHGEPIYDRQWQSENIPAISGQGMPAEGISYPAGTGFSTLPLAALSFRNAQLLWLGSSATARQRGHRNFEVRTLDTPGMNHFISSAETEAKNWAPTPWFTNGGLLSDDPIHHVLYVARGMNGFWRLTVK